MKIIIAHFDLEKWVYPCLLKQVKQEFHTPSLYLCFVTGAKQYAAERSGFMEDT